MVTVKSQAQLEAMRRAGSILRDTLDLLVESVQIGMSTHDLDMIARDFIIPRLLQKDLNSPDELQTLLAPIRGNEFAKAAFDHFTSLRQSRLFIRTFANNF